MNNKLFLILTAIPLLIFSVTGNMFTILPIAPLVALLIWIMLFIKRETLTAKSKKIIVIFLWIIALAALAFLLILTSNIGIG
ncbi:MAG: hypothetical protein ACI4JM_10745 [Oscillospiraceae bacterium]